MRDDVLGDFIVQITAFAECVVDKLGHQIESVLYYPHPFHIGGIVVVFKDDAEPFLDMLSEVYICARVRISLHCLRRSELFKLSLPGIFVLPNPVSEHLHLALWLRHKGIVIYGRDLRNEIKDPINWHLWLNIHIEACQHSVRPGFILSYLMSESYLALIDEMGRQIRYVMATALLTLGVWDISMETVPQNFEAMFPDEKIKGILEKFSSLYRVDQANESACRQAAYESVWLFESFLQSMRKHSL